MSAISLTCPTCNSRFQVPGPVVTALDVKCPQCGALCRLAPVEPAGNRNTAPVPAWLSEMAPPGPAAPRVLSPELSTVMSSIRVHCLERGLAQRHKDTEHLSFLRVCVPLCLCAYSTMVKSASGVTDFCATRSFTMTLRT